MTGRRTTLELCLNGTDVSESVAHYLLNLTYTDNETGEADDLQLTLQDRDGLWRKAWIQAAIGAAAQTREERSVQLEIGQTVYSSAVRHYTASTSDQGYSTRPGWGRITNINRNGKHPYHLIHVDGTTNLYGWVNAEDIRPGQNKEERDGGAADVHAAILQVNWDGGGQTRRLDCGTFRLDAVEASGPPSVITLRATSLGYLGTLRQVEHSQAWESYTLSGIAREIAARAGIALSYLAQMDPYFERKEQYRQSDIAFLKRLCDDAGLALKATGESLVLYDQREYEEKTPVLTIAHKDGSYIDYRVSYGEAVRQVQACRVSYTDPQTGRLIEGVARTEDWEEDGENQQLEVTARVNSIAQAEALAEMRLRLHNRFSCTAEFTLPGNTALAAGETVRLADWGAWDGIYLLTQARHSVGAGGYTTALTLRKVGD